MSDPLYGLTPAEKRAAKHKIATQIVSEVEKFGIDDEQRVKIIFNLAMGLENHEKLQELGACIKTLYPECFLTADSETT